MEKEIKMRKTIAGIRYFQYPNGVLVPETLLKEPGAKVSTPKDTVHYFHDIAHSPVEMFAVVTLDGNNQVIKRHIVSQGTVNSCQNHPREVFRPALLDNACSILVAHNHPSTNLEPSESDLIATRRLVEVSKTMGIPVLDHLIVAQDKHLSIRDRYPHYFG